jgi:hypothetical protein
MNKKTLSRLLLILLALATTQVNAQLSGTYTINSSAAASSTNYTSFASAIFDLNSATGSRPDGGTRNGPGISGPVVFNISAATYNERNTLTAVTGASAINTITFQGVDSMQSVLTFTNAFGDNHTLKLTGAKYIRLKNLGITNQRTDASKPLVMEAGSNNNEVRNCYFNSAIEMSMGNASVLIKDSKGCLVSNCRILGGGYGVGLVSSSYLEGNEVSDNFIAASYYCLYVENQTEPKILRNTIISNCSVCQYGIFLLGASDIEIDRNKVYGKHAALFPNGMYAGRITNNFLTGGAYAINNFTGMGGVKIYHNTLRGFSDPYGSIRNNSMQNCDVVNNIFYTTGGPLLYMQSEYSVDSSNNFDYNNYIAVPGGKIAKMGAVFLQTLTDLQNAPPYFHHMNSDTVRVSFVSESNHDYHLSSFAGAPIGDTSIKVLYDIDGELRCQPYMGADGPPVGSGGSVTASFFAPDSVDLNDTISFSADTTGGGGSNSFSWDIYNDGSTEFSGMHAVWIFNIPGTYQVKLNALNCSGSDTMVRTIVVKDTTGNPPIGIAENYGSLGFGIFPNPAHSHFTLKLSRDLQQGEIKVLSITGQELKSMNNLSGQEFRIERENLEAGFYFLLLSENGTLLGIRKLIME